MSLPPDRAHINMPRSLASLAANAHVHPGGMLKLPEDLERYEHIIVTTQPDVVVETGTRTGGSALWFAARGCDVVTVDVNQVWSYDARVICVTGNSADPAVADRVAGYVAGRRCMVSLDSDHSGPHVSAEIRLYGPLVSPGCFLVVEDGIFGYADHDLRAQHGLAGMVGSPMNAIATLLDGNPDWVRDLEVEDLHPITHHPAGWWRRV